MRWPAAWMQKRCVNTGIPPRSSACPALRIAGPLSARHIGPVFCSVFSGGREVLCQRNFPEVLEVLTLEEPGCRRANRCQDFIPIKFGSGIAWGRQEARNCLVEEVDGHRHIRGFNSSVPHLHCISAISRNDFSFNFPSVEWLMNPSRNLLSQTCLRTIMLLLTLTVLATSSHRCGWAPDRRNLRNEGLNITVHGGKEAVEAGSLGDSRSRGSHSQEAEGGEGWRSHPSLLSPCHDATSV